MTNEVPTAFWQENRAFFQANLVKGGRYLDDAGKIINDYADEYQDTSVGVEGLRFAEPTKDDIPDEIAVNVSRIWIACYGEDCIERITETTGPIVRKISEHIGVDEYRRLGLRVYYFKPIEDPIPYFKQLYLTTTSREFQTLVGSSDRVSEMHLTAKYESKPFSVKIELHPIRIQREAKTKSEFTSSGAIIDIDVVEGKESSSRALNRHHISGYLTESSKYIRDKAEQTIILLRGVQ